MADYEPQQYEAWLREFFPEGTLENDEFNCLCPFHADETPSYKFNIQKGVGRCLVCDAKGDVFKLCSGEIKKSYTKTKRVMLAAIGGEADISIVSQDLVYNFHQVLIKNKPAQSVIAKKGISLDTIKRFKIGLDGTRFTFPIYDQFGNVVNIRKYKPDARGKDAKRKTMNMKGFGTPARLFPVESLEAEFIVIVEGEAKSALLCQMGFNAVSPTAGSGTWLEEWSQLFTGKDVAIIYDIDKGGRKGANKICRLLFPHAKSIKDILLPLDPIKFRKGDLTDYVISCSADATEIQALIDGAIAWQPEAIVEDRIDDEELHDVELSDSSKGKWSGKFIRSNVVVSAKDTAPFIVPETFTVACPKDKDICMFCPIMNADDPNYVVEIDPRKAVILEMLNVSKERLDKVLQRAAGIPAKCDACRFKIGKARNVEEVRLIPQLTIGFNTGEQVARRAFYVGHGIETNAPHEIKARVVPDPTTQYATLIIHEAKPAVDSLSTFQLDDEDRAALSIFQPKEWTVDGIDQKLRYIYNDFAANVTHIFQRQDLHLVLDLMYHSALYIPFQGKVRKGWTEALIIGDSGQGKSETDQGLRTHYGLGEKIDGKTASVAGLIGGVSETQKRKFITWGRIPLNDKRLLTLDEIKGMREEIIANLTDVRSSGVAGITKIESAKTNARCRLIWISNPRSDRQIASYNFGVEAIKELMGSLEDVRRFDIAIIVASGEVGDKWLNMALADRPKRKHRYTSEFCRNLILWAWSRTEHNVEIPDDTEAEILKQASAMSRKFCSQIPLVEPADHRLKLLRLATALAARTFSSTDNGNTLYVRPCHVAYVAQFMDKIYSAPMFGYDSFSRLILGEGKLEEIDAVKAYLRKLPHSRDVVRNLLEMGAVSVYIMQDLTGQDRDEAQAHVSELLRKGAIKRSRNGYVKTAGFIALLKELTQEALENKTVSDKTNEKEQEF